MVAADQTLASAKASALAPKWELVRLADRLAFPLEFDPAAGDPLCRGRPDAACRRLPRWHRERHPPNARGDPTSRSAGAAVCEPIACPPSEMRLRECSKRAGHPRAQLTVIPT